MRVVVIGAGKAGTEAAREASRAGAEVTLVDSLRGPLPDWQSWPDLIHDGFSAGRVPSPRSPAGVTCAFETRVTSLAGGAVTTVGGRKLVADSLVLATGSGFEGAYFEGRSKPGVTILDSPEKYSALGRDMASADAVVVSGEGGRGLQVAEKAAGRGRRVALFISSWQHAAPGPLASRVLFDAAEQRGVSVRAGRVSRALGAVKLEAVLAQGEVVPAGALAVAPRRTPRPVLGPAGVGKRGGVKVGLDLRTSTPGILAAGGCAELSEGSPSGASLEDEQEPSGRTAGANATGSTVVMPHARRVTCSVFGLVWTCVGTGIAAARAAGLEVDSVGERRDEVTSCALVYDRATGRVLGLEAVHEQRACGVAIPGIVTPTTLRSLAYDGSLGSSDISMVSETARLGLQAWSRS